MQKEKHLLEKSSKVSLLDSTSLSSFSWLKDGLSGSSTDSVPLYLILARRLKADRLDPLARVWKVGKWAFGYLPSLQGYVWFFEAHVLRLELFLQSVENSLRSN